MGDLRSWLENWLDYILFSDDYPMKFVDHPPCLEQDPTAPPLSAEIPPSPVPNSLSQQPARSSPENPQHSGKCPLHQRPEKKPVQMACRLVQYLGSCLPIRSFFAFQVLSGISSFSNKSVTATLVSVLGIVCFASCFTDSSNIHSRVYFRHVYAPHMPTKPNRILSSPLSNRAVGFRPCRCVHDGLHSSSVFRPERDGYPLPVCIGSTPVVASMGAACGCHLLGFDLFNLTNLSARDWLRCCRCSHFMQL
ncbi:hypothetical protein NL676_008161 [Syzygium grande]|nr:hypothetical protein NL676_008161 [Syzygium grande]